MTNELVKRLLESGVHSGHQSRRWNPKMKRFIFGERGGIYIIDLEKTVEHLNAARDFARDTAAKGGRFLFVGTKKQAQDIVRAEAERIGMYFINHRWMGGLMTNYETIKQSIRKLEQIEKMSQDGIFARLTKKEIAILTKQKDKLLRDLGGIRNMGRIPDAIFIIDTKKEEIAVQEANRLNIPIIGLVDTNSNPDVIQYPIPGNDDAVKAIKFITALIADSIAEGRKEFVAAETVSKTVPNKEDAPKASEIAVTSSESSSENQSSL